jgi:hypothetical protein
MEELKYKIDIETDRISPEELIDPNAIAALVDLNKQIESYKAQLKELADAEKNGIEVSEESKRKQEELKLALKDAQTEYRNVQKGIQNVDAAVKSSITTYDGLVKENKALMEAMRNVPLNDTTGELKRLQDQFNSNNDELKKFDATLGNHQRNVGNYKSGLGGLTSSLQGLPGPIGGVVAGVKTLNTVIKANPIGLLIAVIAGLIAMLSKLQPVVDFVTKQFQILSNVTAFFIDKIGGMLGLVEQTDVKLGDVIRKTAELADAEVRLRDAKREQIVAISEQDKLVSELRLKAADMNLSEQERLDTLIQIEEVERETLQEKKKLALEELRIAEERAALTHSDAAVLEDIARKKAAINALDVETNNFLIRITQRRTGLEQKAIEDEKRGIEEVRQANEKAHKERLEQIKKEEEARFKEYLKSQENIRQAQLEADKIEFIDLELDTQTQINDGLLKLDKLYADTLLMNLVMQLEEEGRLVEAAELEKGFRIQELTQMFQDAGLSEYEAHLRAKEQADLEYSIGLQKLKEQEAENQKQINQDMLKDGLSIGSALFSKTKAFAVAQAVIDTFAAANSAAKNTPGGVLAKSLAAAAMIAKGIVNVKKILATNPGGASIGGGSTSAGSAVSTAGTLSPAGVMIPQGFNAQSPFATGMASSVGDPSMNRGEINIQANVDRRGLAIAVREGERSIRTQQFDYK